MLRTKYMPKSARLLIQLKSTDFLWPNQGELCEVPVFDMPMRKKDDEDFFVEVISSILQKHPYWNEKKLRGNMIRQQSKIVEPN